jgi:hypothetical protein
MALSDFVRRTDRVLETVFSVLSHGAFSLIVALVLAVLVMTDRISGSVGSCIALAWFTAFLWIARAKTIRDLTILPRLLAIVCIACVLGAAALGINRWALHGRETDETGQANITIALKPEIDLHRGTLWIGEEMQNIGNLTAQQVLPGFTVNVARQYNTAKCVTDLFQLWLNTTGTKMSPNYGINDLPPGMYGRGSIPFPLGSTEPPLKAKDLTDIENGKLVLYMFALVRYRDSRHADLRTLACATYSGGAVTICPTPR